MQEQDFPNPVIFLCGVVTAALTSDINASERLRMKAYITAATSALAASTYSSVTTAIAVEGDGDGDDGADTGLGFLAADSTYRGVSIRCRHG